MDFIDEWDHKIELEAIYDANWRDPLFEEMVRRYESSGHVGVDPWEMLAVEKKEYSWESMEEKVRSIIEDKLTPAQDELYYRYYGKCETLQSIRIEEYERTGKMIGISGMSRRKEKIIKKVTRSIGVKAELKNND